MLRPIFRLIILMIIAAASCTLLNVSFGRFFAVYIMLLVTEFILELAIPMLPEE